MIDFSDTELMRPKLAQLCIMSSQRVNPPEIDIPNRWEPMRVVEPTSLSRYSDDGAWWFIRDCLQDGAAIKYKPPTVKDDDHAYVLIEAPRGGDRRIYMKIALKERVGKIIGVSFHYERTV